MAKSLRLFRNSSIQPTKEAALTALRAQLVASKNDGELMVVRYSDGNDVKSILGITSTLTAGDGTGLKYTIFDSEAIPSEVQDALDKAIEGIKGGSDEEINDAYDTIKEIADALETINGDDSTQGSIAYGDKNTYDSAVTYVNTQIQGLDVADAAVAKKFVTEVSETDGKIAVKRGAITSNGGTVTITDGADGGINLDVVSSALVQYVGTEAIAVSEEAEGEKTISLVINPSDKVLTQSETGLLANINLTWSTTDGLKLLGKSGAEIATIPAADFIKDGMLENVELKTASVEQPVDTATTGTFLVFTFNTDGGRKVINLDVTSLIDVYTAGNGLTLAGKQFSVKLDASTEAFLTVGTDGIKLAGVQAAIDAAKQEVANSVTTLQGEVDSIETAVGLGTDGSFTAPTGGNYVSGSTSVIDAISDLDTQVKANADDIAENAAAIAQETQDRQAADLAINQTIQSIQGEIENITTVALNIQQGNGISIVGGAEEAKTISAVADPSDTFIEVGTNGIRMKDNGVIDLGTY